jgi:hypothetical protein
MKVFADPVPYNNFGGRTLYPGAYRVDAAAGLTGAVPLYLSVLEKEGGDVDPDPKWTFYLGGAFTTGAFSKIVFVGADRDGGGAVMQPQVLYDPTDLPGSYFYTSGADITTFFEKSPVQFKVVGAVTLGANSHMNGDVKAGGAITVGASATCGNLEALGAITLGAGSSAGNVRAAGALSKGGEDYASYGTVYNAADLDDTDVHADLVLCKTRVSSAKYDLQAELTSSS